MRAGGIGFSCSALGKKGRSSALGKKWKEGSALVGSIARKKTSARGWEWNRGGCWDCDSEIDADNYQRYSPGAFHFYKMQQG